jgi:hypothetical protein
MRRQLPLLLALVRSFAEVLWPSSKHLGHSLLNILHKHRDD